MNKVSNQKDVRKTHKFEYWRNFKVCRIKSKLTQAKASDKDHLDILKSILCNYENNKSEPPLAIIVKMSKVYKVSLKDLLTKDLYEPIYKSYSKGVKKSRLISRDKFYKKLDYTILDVFYREVDEEMSEMSDAEVGIIRDKKGNIIN